MADGGTFRLQVPAEAVHMATVRLFVAACCRVLEVDEEVIADVKLAVSEAGAAVVAAGGGDILTVTLSLGATGIVASVAPVTGNQLATDSPSHADVIAALFPAATVDAGTRSLVIPLSAERIA